MQAETAWTIASTMLIEHRPLLTLYKEIAQNLFLYPESKIYI